MSTRTAQNRLREQLNMNCGHPVGGHFAFLPTGRSSRAEAFTRTCTAHRVRRADRGHGSDEGDTAIPLFEVLEEAGLTRIDALPGAALDFNCTATACCQPSGLQCGDIRRLRSYLTNWRCWWRQLPITSSICLEVSSASSTQERHSLPGRNITSYDRRWRSWKAIAGGERDPRKLARLRDPRFQGQDLSLPTLQGHWREELLPRPGTVRVYLCWRLPSAT